jgi:heterodisulfide reductase subunit B
MDDRYRFFAGCIARLKLPHIEMSVRKVLSATGFDLEDEAGFTCCPDPVVFRSASREEWLAVAARNLSLNGDDPIVTLCPGCASSLSEARHMLHQDAQLAADVGARLDRLGLRLGLPKVSHFVRLLCEGDVPKLLEGMLSKRLEGLKVACHYGCHLVRPSDAVGFDDPEKPRSLDDLVGLTGAISLDYEDKYLCCGRPSLDEATSMAIAEHKLESMSKAGCDVVVVACPFCFEQFELGQVVISRKSGKDFGLPVLYVSQLLGLAMGMEPDKVGLNFHKIPLKKLGYCDDATI